MNMKLKILNRTWITSALVMLTLSGTAMASTNDYIPKATMPNNHVVTLAPIIVKADSTEATPMHVTLSKVTPNNQDAKVVLNSKGVILSQEPYSILINKDKIQEHVSDKYALAPGDTLVTILMDKINHVVVKINMKSENYQQTFVSTLTGSNSSVNIFPTTGDNEALVLNINKDTPDTMAMN
jgi:hypothetical protein